MKQFAAALYSNHVLANLLFILVLALGYMSFMAMPREQDPTINFNWIDITTVVPGMASADVETRVTDVLEDEIRTIADIKFVSSNSRDSFSSVLVRFEDIDEDEFDKRVIELRRNISNAEAELPDEAYSPVITEITTANAFPSATLVVTAEADDENLRRNAQIIKGDLEQIEGVNSVITTALQEPEFHIDFDPERLESIGISPTALADTVAVYFRDISAGSAQVGEQTWSVRLKGTGTDPQILRDLPLLGAGGEVRIGDVAQVTRTREPAQMLASLAGKPAVILGITKKESSNTLALVERLNDYIAQRNRTRDSSGVTVFLADDQTEVTRNALNIMQTNAVLGLFLVLLVTWAFLGWRIAFFTSIGIPFILAGTFWLLAAMEQTLNVSVLLGVVISLGMLVDDAVVVVEGIYYRLQRGMAPMKATLETLAEVVSPVTAAVLTTMAAFLPLMLLPGIVGKFMMVIPLVVTTALAISLIEAYYMLPSHLLTARLDFSNPGRVQRLREKVLHSIRVKYTRLLTRSLRYPVLMLSSVVLVFILSLFCAFAGQVNPGLFNHPVLKHFLVKTDFFASDPLRLFYISVEMPNGTPLQTTMDKVVEVEQKVQQHLRADETRSVVSYAGRMWSETAPFIGDHYGQILVTLKPKTQNMREVSEVIEAMRADVSATLGPAKLFFMEMAGGPPVSKPISIKIRGDNLEQLRAATRDIKTVLNDSGFAHDISDDDSPGLQEMVLSINSNNARRAGISPAEISRVMRLMVDGEIAASMRDRGETVDVRVRAAPREVSSIEQNLQISLPGADGSPVPLRSLVDIRYQTGLGNIRHYNFRRTITVESEIDNTKTDPLAANNTIRRIWSEELQARYPAVNLDFSGQLDDINESLDAMARLMLLGVLLMYLILGTQFRSYFQPLLILATIPMAFTGVVAGLLVTGNPLSLWTLYGVVALTGIAVNAAIVLISAANQRLRAGMSVLHATLYAARRRVIPILITSTTTVAGLFSLATGLGGHSLVWGPVATAIVWGLVVSTSLTLFVVPLLYRMFMARRPL
ncbi:efflux RND transporter permease subunit [Granulosicoccaceae sp. 1_MG-2023]|nr:efflux RND transporter permease subunit [Granulosicoccaceae sp. 1_MG-2023]